MRRSPSAISPTFATKISVIAFVNICATHRVRKVAARQASRLERGWPGFPACSESSFGPSPDKCSNSMSEQPDKHFLSEGPVPPNGQIRLVNQQKVSLLIMGQSAGPWSASDTSDSGFFPAVEGSSHWEGADEDPGLERARHPGVLRRDRAEPPGQRLSGGAHLPHTRYGAGTGFHGGSRCPGRLWPLSLYG